MKRENYKHGQATWWAQFTPEQRKRIMQKRMKKWAPESKAKWAIKSGRPPKKRPSKRELQDAVDRTLSAMKRKPSPARVKPADKVKQQSRDMQAYWANMTPKQRKAEADRRNKLRQETIRKNKAAQAAQPPAQQEPVAAA